MAPESEAPTRGLYDHESDEPRRRRRTAADWGVNEDIFDRMPSRFERIERRAEHQEIVLRRDDDATSVAVVEPETWERASEAGRGGTVARVRGDEVARGPGAPARTRGDLPARGGVTARTERASRRSDSGELDPRAAARAMMSWGEDLDDEAAPMVPGESRTIVLSRDAGVLEDGVQGLGARGLDEDSGARMAYEPMLAGELARDTGEYVRAGGEYVRVDDEAGAPHGRKTIKISGHPDRLPAPRTQRPPRTAVERIGHRPDRIVAYAVALGFLLVLIAVLTTGQ